MLVEVRPQPRPEDAADVALEGREDGALDFFLDDVAMDGDNFFLEGSEDGTVDGIDEADTLKEETTGLPDEKC